MIDPYISGITSTCKAGSQSLIARCASLSYQLIRRTLKVQTFILIPLLYLTFTTWLFDTQVAMPAIGSGRLVFKVSSGGDAHGSGTTWKVRRHVPPILKSDFILPLIGRTQSENTLHNQPHSVSRFPSSHRFFNARFSDKAPPLPERIPSR